MRKKKPARKRASQNSPRMLACIRVSRPVAHLAPICRISGRGSSPMLCDSTSSRFSPDLILAPSDALQDHPSGRFATTQVHFSPRPHRELDTQGDPIHERGWRQCLWFQTKRGGGMVFDSRYRRHEHHPGFDRRSHDRHHADLPEHDG
ncbi:hypothetical protein PSP6_70067 [Paraburkholderia tropica]|nr:hypothetical protein PSP6_70067 [Paraburkholderia tropica]